MTGSTPVLPAIEQGSNDRPADADTRLQRELGAERAPGQRVRSAVTECRSGNTAPTRSTTGFTAGANSAPDTTVSTAVALL